jgi:hypothetical protein
LVFLVVSLATTDVVSPSDGAQGDSPQWESEFVVWPRYEGQPTPWRDDSRIKNSSPEGYPDDFPVVFDNPDPAAQDELIWVTAIDYHAPTDEYLGIVLNTPFNLKSIRERDNAVFKYDPETSQLHALAASGDYGRRGLPQRASRGVHAELWEGIRQYRLGNYGHNQPAIEQCIEVLSAVAPRLGDSASTDDSFLAYFVLGRCNAEAYNTDAAIEAFRSALEFNNDDVDAHMALLAEYTLKVHPRLDQPPEAYDASWEPLLVEQLNYVRREFPDDPAVATATTIIFDESEVTNLSELSEEEIARRRKVGFGIFRWKRR